MEYICEAGRRSRMANNTYSLAGQTFLSVLLRAVRNFFLTANAVGGHFNGQNPTFIKF